MFPEEIRACFGKLGDEAKLTDRRSLEGAVLAA